MKIKAIMKGREAFELKVFTLPTCTLCPAAKQIAFEVAEKLGLRCREISLSTQEGYVEGVAHKVLSTPSIFLNDEVIVSGRLISREKLEEEIRRRIESWASHVAPK